jgi:aryl-alcohol dehydrogenase-like predicted oxidoreductase
MEGAMAEQIALGATDIRLAPLGVGTWAWGDRLFWGYGGGYQERDVAEAFQASLDAGVTLFDTAEIYGPLASERIVGRLVREAGRPALVATKYWPSLPWRRSARSIRAALMGSLGRLGLERVDLYQIHWPSPLLSPAAMMEAMADLAAEGRVRAVGVSNFSAAQMREAHAALARRGVPLASNQVEYSLLHRAPEANGVLDACRELGVTLIAYSPLAMGALTGKYGASAPPSGPRRFQARFQRRALAEAAPVIELLRAVGEAHGGKTPAQVALRWLIGRGALPIPGAKSARQAAANAGALGWELTPGEAAALESATERWRTA